MIKFLSLIILFQLIASTGYSNPLSLPELRKNSQIIELLEKTGNYTVIQGGADSQWQEVLRFEQVGLKGNLRLRIQELSSNDEAKQFFLEIRRDESTGGASSDLQIGDQVVMFGDDRYLIQQGNWVYMVSGGNDVEKSHIVAFNRNVETILASLK